MSFTLHIDSGDHSRIKLINKVDKIHVERNHHYNDKVNLLSSKWIDSVPFRDNHAIEIIFDGETEEAYFTQHFTLDSKEMTVDVETYKIDGVRRIMGKGGNEFVDVVYNESHSNTLNIIPKNKK